MRGLSKPKEVGGDADYNYEEEIPVAEVVGMEPTAPPISQINKQLTTPDTSIEQPSIEANAPPLSRLDILKNKLNELGNELSETEQAESMDKQYELKRIKNDIDAVTQEINSLSQGQKGGKKQKKLNFNKKYNIRWT
jgi:hypothetical protein